MKTTVIHFSNFRWHDLGFLSNMLICLGSLGNINRQDVGKKTKKSKILVTKEKNQDLRKKLKNIQDYPRSSQKSQDVNHWDFEEILSRREMP